MKRFNFKFKAVLNVRKNRENDALSNLGAAQRSYQAEVTRKQDLQFRLKTGLERREALGQRSATPALSFQLEQAYITGIKHRITQADQAIVRASRSVEKALRAYLFARRQTRMIEVLHEKAYAEFRRERAKKERKEQDELTIMRARFSDQAAGSLFAGDSREESA